MSGGRLVVLDRHGRDMKRYSLPEGLATLGSDPACDIRVMLPAVSAHHATVVVHANQTVVRNVSDGETLVNGRGVSVAALRHGDVISVGGRSLRWDYTEPDARKIQKLTPEIALGAVPRAAGRAGRAARRATGGAGAGGALARAPAVRLALEMSHRASMPGGAGGKQVAIVQPQRRDTNDQSDKPPPRTPVQSNKRRSKTDLDTSNDSDADNSKRRTTARMSPKNVNLQTTKATLWIESRKTSPRKTAKVQTPTQVLASVRRSMPTVRKSTPLRLTVLKKAQSAQKMRVMKIEAPLKIDHTKQAAIMLMTGHTPKTRLPSPKNTKKSPSYVVKKPSPVRKSPGSRGRKSTARRSKETATPASIEATPKRNSTYTNTTRRSSQRLGNQTVTILEITDSDAQHSTALVRDASRRSAKKSPQKSPLLSSPKKSALKDPKAKKSMRKTESIKFDLSNLENRSQSMDVLMVTDASKHSYNGDSASEDDLTLHFSDSSSVLSPSPRRSIHSRSSKILEKSLGTTMTISPPSRTLSPESPRVRKSGRGSIILQKALNNSEGTQSHSRRSTKSPSDRTQSIINGSAYRTRTLSPRSPSRNELEAYSIVDLVSIDSNETGRSTSVYNSAGSANTTTFGTPQNSSGRKTRSTINPSLLGSSTPYVRGQKSMTRSQSTPNTTSGTNNLSQVTTRSSVSTRRSKSLSTPENSEDTKKHISVNSTKISRASKSRSRLNDSDLLLVEGEDNDDSPKSSKRSRGKSNQGSPLQNISKNATTMSTPEQYDGTITPEHRYSPEEATTPVLSIQSLLNSSQSSLASYKSQNKGRGRQSGPFFVTKRNTIGGISEPKTRVVAKSKSTSFTARKTRLRLSSDSAQGIDESMHTDQVVTPKSAVKLLQEEVKNKHSTAKKPHSKRSLIDDLNESDIVKQLFNSPVKRKLSQSMMEFSRKQLFDDDDDVVPVKRPARHTIALTGRTSDISLSSDTDSITPERFVSPINTPSISPNFDGIKRLFGKNTPNNDLSNVRGVKKLLKTPRTRRSIRNDLTNVSGVKSLFHTQSKAKSPNNDLSDVRGVKKLFKSNRSPTNDLRNVSGVKRTMQRNSPRNDLTDVRGVKRMFREEREDHENNGLDDISGVEELFNISNRSRETDSLFDRLLGRPPIRAVYSKTLSARPTTKKKTNRKSLHASLDLITNNVEQWLEQELQKRLHKNEASTSRVANRSNLSLTRELQKLATSTVEGTSPLRNSRVRNSTLIRSIQADASERKKSASELYSAHTLPIKKRSLVDRSIDKAKASKATLPIKKRVVIHSTPVKGRVNMTMNASELGRVSPIAAVDKTAYTERDASLRPNQQSAEPTEESLKPRGRRPNKAKQDDRASTTSIEVPKPSPKKTRAKSKPVSPKTKTVPVKSRSTRQTKAKVVKSLSSDSTKVVSSPNKASPAKPSSSKPKSPSPVKLRATRARKNTATTETNVKRRRASLVVTKKAPIMSRKPRATRLKKHIASPKVTPKKTRATRKKDKVEVKTPKNTRTKAQKASVVDSEPSPLLKPKAAETKQVEVVSRRTRKAESRQQSQDSTQAIDVPKTRGRRAEVAKQVSTESEPNATRGRRAKAGAKKEERSIVEGPKTTRGKKILAQASVQSEPTTRGRRNAQVSEARTRKRKTVSEEKVPTKVAKSKEIVETRGRKRIIQTTETETANGRQKRSVVKDSKVEITRQGSGDGNKTTRVVRSKKIVEVTKTESEHKTRGEKQAPDVVESAPEIGKPSPLKEAGMKQPAGKKSRKIVEAASPVKATRARRTRAKNAEPEVSVEPAGRSRRR